MKRGLWRVVGIGIALSSACLPAQAGHGGVVIRESVCDEPAITLIPSQCSTAVTVAGTSFSIRSVVSTPNDGADFATDGDTAYTQVSLSLPHFPLDPGASVDVTASLDVTTLQTSVSEALDLDGRAVAIAGWALTQNGSAGWGSHECSAIVQGINTCAIRITNPYRSVKSASVSIVVGAAVGVEGWPLDSEIHVGFGVGEICVPERIDVDPGCRDYVRTPGVGAAVALEAVRGRAQLSLDASISFIDYPTTPS